ncbi:PAS domain-containing sensor histidine kinase [Peribacillus frigoritolerans]|uniref:PAS domain-containing sensor histidine kinase n=1 Tax=Peribacillus frigoritolerans TaxID=450367 RepID=UPI00227EFFA5|nr:PAS domain-containing sensor histidine kinase [Peribacillus frigoritolerans]MCY9138122.1 PAS domain S-box protein [Peribacillus frigoritolerans]
MSKRLIDYGQGQMGEQPEDSTEKFKSFMENNPDAISIVDLEGKTLQVNAAFEEFFGWTNDELIGMPFPIIPDFLKESVNELHDQIKAGVQKKGFETVRLRKDGQLIDVSISLFNIRDNENEPCALVFVYRDITNQKLAEAALKESEQRYRSLVEVSPEAIFVHRNGIIEYMNPMGAKMLGMDSVEDIIGKSVFQFVHLESRESVQKRIEIMRDDHQAVGLLEQKFIRLDGQEFYGETLGLPIIYKGQPAIQVFCRDITERKKTEELICKSNMLSAVGQMAAGIAHEIRNPLTTVKGFLQLLREDPEQKEYLEMTVSEVEKIEILANEFLSLAEPEAKVCEIIQLNEILDSVITLAEFQAILNDVEIIKEYNTDSASVFGEPNQLKQVFTNVVNNAIEAMPNGGKLHIQLNHEGDFAMIRFIDQGCGISNERMKHLGQPFYSTSEKGTGFGLMVSTKIIHEHNGEIHFTSEVGEGTIVDISLPINESSQ